MCQVVLNVFRSCVVEILCLFVRNFKYVYRRRHNEVPLILISETYFAIEWRVFFFLFYYLFLRQWLFVWLIELYPTIIWSITCVLNFQHACNESAVHAMQQRCLHFLHRNTWLCYYRYSLELLWTFILVMQIRLTVPFDFFE